MKMAKRIEITSAQREEIEAARKKNRNKTVERRLQALLMRANGKSLQEISEATGYHYAHVSQLISKYAHGGLDPVVKSEYGGNRRNLSYEEEAQLLKPYIEKVEAGQLVDVKELAEAYQKSVDHKTGDYQVYRVLKRHGWRKVMPRSKHPKSASPEEVESSKKLTRK